MQVPPVVSVVSVVPTKVKLSKSNLMSQTSENSCLKRIDKKYWEFTSNFTRGAFCDGVSDGGGLPVRAWVVWVSNVSAVLAHCTLTAQDENTANPKPGKSCPNS